MARHQTVQLSLREFPIFWSRGTYLKLTSSQERSAATLAPMCSSKSIRAFPGARRVGVITVPTSTDYHKSPHQPTIRLRTSDSKSRCVRGRSLVILRPGDNWVMESKAVCVLTRLGLRSLPDLLRTYFDYRKVISEERRGTGLLKSSFLIEDRRTCCIISIWKDYRAIPEFGTRNPTHALVARMFFGRCRMNAVGRPEIFSAKWRLISISNNIAWADLDLMRAVSKPDVACDAGKSDRPVPAW
jgi:hypothetical protein